MKKLILFSIIFFSTLGITKLCAYTIVEDGYYRKVKVSSFGVIPPQSKVCIVHQSNVVDNSWLHKNFRTYLARSLEANKYVLVQNPSNADYIMYYEYAISEPFVERVKKQRLLDKASVSGGSSTSSVSGSASSYEYYEEEVTYYQRSFSLKAYSRASKSETVWEMETQSSGTVDRLDVILPYLFAASQKLFCKASGRALVWTTDVLFGDKPIVKRVEKYLLKPYE